MKVFIADDSSIVRERLIDLLSKLKEIEIIGQTGDPIEVLDSIRKLTTDLVILDLRMLGGSGIDALRAIKNEEHAPTVVVLTNCPYPQFRRECTDAGADFFFDKSTEFGEMINVLRGLIVGANSRSSD